MLPICPSPSTRIERIKAVNGIIPENTAAVDALQRFIPSYQNINASAVTINPYQTKASQAVPLTFASRLKGCSKKAGPEHRIKAIAETSRVLTSVSITTGFIEDDYDSEFRYCGTPVAPLFSMDSDRVIYIGTFSKTLFPALRIGYIILPSQLQTRWRYLRTHIDVQNPPFEQAALAEYLRTRKFDRHIQHMRKLYGQKREFLFKTLGEVFGNAWNSWGDAAGLHMAIEFPERVFNKEFIKQIRTSGIYITPVDYHCINKGVHLNKILLGYGHLEEEEIRQGILLLHDLMLSN